jgi:hypothetical protein
MLSTPKLVLFITFVVALAIWVGSGVFDSLSSHPPWWADPAGYVRNQTPYPGTINPWPMTTALVGLCTLAGLVTFARHRGPGRREALIVFGGQFLILLATGFYFVPTLLKLANHAALTDAQIVDMSHTWMVLNTVRIVVVLTLLAYSQVALLRLASSQGDAVIGFPKPS